MKHVVFDIGAVLINWHPALAWSDELGLYGSRAFLNRVGFEKLNFACDGGVLFEDAAQHVADPQDAARVAQYVERYAKTLPSRIEGSWECLYALKEADARVFAITNWSAQTWPAGCAVYPELAEVFETTVVSGQVGMLKPGVGIYHHFLEKAGVAAEDCVFTDDGLHNCLGARAVGMDAIHFTGPDALEAGLKDRGLL